MVTSLNSGHCSTQRKSIKEKIRERARARARPLLNFLQGKSAERYSGHSLFYAGVAQLVERYLPKVNVVSSNLIAR